MENFYKFNNSTGEDEVKKVRLRAVESESDYFFKLLSILVIRKFVMIQAAAAVVIFICQILLYATVTTGYYKPVDYTGIGIWGPLVFYSVAAGLSWMTTKSPSGCIIGTAMGFQIVTVLVTIIMIVFSSISLVMHGRYIHNYDRDGDNSSRTYDPEVAGRVFCSFMILSGAVVLITAVFICVQYCRATCCSRQKTTEAILFDVEAVK